MSKFNERFKQIFERLCAEDFSTALTLICPLIDGAGKKLYGIKKPGERFKKVISDNNAFLYWMLTGGTFVMADGSDFVFGRENKEDISLGQAIYSLVRNSLLHEGELSDEIEFVSDGRFGSDGHKIVFPKNLLWALAFMLSYLECYKNDCPVNYQLSISGIQMPINETWGSREKVMIFFNRNLFKK